MAFDFPSSPAEGQIFNAPGGPSYVFNTPVWKAVGQGQIAIISDTPPPSPANGALWYESDSGVLYIWYNDGNSSQWVQVGGITGGQPDNITSIAADMRAGFTTGPNRFVVNDKPDGTGTNVAAIDDTGKLTVRGLNAPTAGNTIVFDWSAASALTVRIDATAEQYLWSGYNVPYSLGSSGYIKFPNGVIIQWGTSTNAAADYTISFPIAFPNYVFAKVGNPNYDGIGGGTLQTVQLSGGGLSTTNIRCRSQTAASTAGTTSQTTTWIAIGY